ncbi:MAG: MFS transporter [Planctomycetota bacterium]
MTHEVQSQRKSRRLPAAVWLLSWVSLLADISGEMMFPLLPLFLVGVLKVSTVELGAIEGLALLVVALMSAYAGLRSDRRGPNGVGRVPWIRWGYGLPVLGKSLIAIAGGWWLVLAGRLLDRLGKGLRGAPRDALIADAVDKSQRGQAFGLHRAIDTIGALLGVLISALLLWLLSGSPRGAGSVPVTGSDLAPEAWVYRAVFAVSALLGLGSWLLTLVIREPQVQIQITEKDDSTLPAISSAASAEGWAALPKRYWVTLGIFALFGLANSSDAFLLLRAQELGFAPWAVVLVYALFNVAYAAASYPAGDLSDRWGRWRMIGVGWGIYVLVYLLFAALTSEMAWAVWPLMALYGLYMALTEGVAKALVGDCAPKAVRGRAMGLFHAINGVSTLLASILVGVVWEVWGARIALLLSGVLCGVALGTCVCWKYYGSKFE